jgi:tyrosyl-tRNA synthetase
MGKSLGNYIGVGEGAYDQFAKTMSIPDHLMQEWFELLTDLTPAEIARFLDAKQTKPMDAKKVLGIEIAKFYHGEAAACAARTEWESRFSAKQDPTEIAEVTVPAGDLTNGKLWICKLLVTAGLAKGSNEARRHVANGGVTVGPDRTKITDEKAAIPVTDGLIIRVGKREVRRVRLG